MKYIKDRISDIKDNKYFLQEEHLFKNNKLLSAYYEYIYNNVNIEKDNPENSYIMWAVGKVDKIDKDKPANIVSGHISLPDVDMDFSPAFRQNIINYLKEKYGYNNVAQIITFSREQGRVALKDVLRAYQACSFEEMNKITEFIPDEASIADELQECEHDSTILWALENNAEQLKQWAYLKDGNIQGPMSKFFRLAIKVEHIYRHASRHAGGVIISPIPIDSVCPLMYDKSLNDRIIGVDMKDVEYLGLVKVDILGVNTLEKLENIRKLLLYDMLE